jgi:hypothetical protein
MLWTPIELSYVEDSCIFYTIGPQTAMFPGLHADRALLPPPREYFWHSFLLGVEHNPGRPCDWIE